MQEVRGPEDIEVMSALLFPDKGIFEAMCKRWPFDSLQRGL